MAKSIKNVYDDLVTYETLYRAYVKARKGKRNRIDVIEFSLNYEYELKKMVKELKDLTYTFGKYTLFYVYEPKERKILSAPFRDRIVHTWYVENFLLPYFTSSFMYHSYACIKDKGMHECSKNVLKTLRKCSRVYPKGYILKMDIKKYFENIDRKVLYEIISKRIKDKKFLSLTRKILDSTKDWDMRHGVSLPIGNYCSQMFANIYLDELDKYLKEKLRLKYVFRYMDDVVVILETKEKAKEVLNLVKTFLLEKLHLELNKKTQIFKVTQGVNFCGYKITKRGIRLRTRGKKKVVQKLKYIRYNIRKGNMSIPDAKRLLAGHMGYMCIARVDGIVKKYF